MLKNILVVCFTMAIVLPGAVNALDLRFQPRFKTGIQYYEYEQESFQTPARDPQGQFPNMQGNLKYNDWLPFVSGGATFFVDRFFVDLDVIHSFDGQDDSNSRNQNFLSPFSPADSGTVLETNTNQDADFDRTEWAVSVGFEVIENLAVFAGYKKSKTEFDSKLSGDSVGRALDTSGNLSGNTVPFLTGTFTGKLDQEFEYDGPFVGAAYNWRINRGFLDGALSFNFAVAFMDGNVDLEFEDVVATTDAGVGTIDFQSLGEEQGRGSFSGLDGDTIGFSFGTAWRGFTPIEGLVYSVGVSGYRYKFNSNDTPDFSETQVRFDFSLAYAFDFGI